MSDYSPTPPGPLTGAHTATSRLVVTAYHTLTCTSRGESSYDESCVGVIKYLAGTPSPPEPPRSQPAPPPPVPSPLRKGQAGEGMLTFTLGLGARVSTHVPRMFVLTLTSTLACGWHTRTGYGYARACGERMFGTHVRVCVPARIVNVRTSASAYVDVRVRTHVRL